MKLPSLDQAIVICGGLSAVAFTIARARAFHLRAQISNAAHVHNIHKQLMTSNAHHNNEVALRKRIAVLGGSFNPITNAHLSIAASVAQSGLVDEVKPFPSNLIFFQNGD